jgi:hypothetical protein
MPGWFPHDRQRARVADELFVYFDFGPALAAHIAVVLPKISSVAAVRTQSVKRNIFERLVVHQPIEHCERG